MYRQTWHVYKCCLLIFNRGNISTDTSTPVNLSKLQGNEHTVDDLEGSVKLREMTSLCCCLVHSRGRCNDLQAFTRCRLQLKCDGTRWRKEGKWRGNWRMEWVASTLHTTSEHGVSSIITADAHTSAVSSRLNWRLRRFKWTRPFRRKTKSDFRACAITFQTQSTASWKML